MYLAAIGMTAMSGDRLVIPMRDQDGTKRSPLLGRQVVRKLWKRCTSHFLAIPVASKNVSHN